MRSLNLLCSSSRIRGFALTGCVVCFTAATCAAKKPQELLPTVISAGTPIYPLIARQARVEGTVKLRLSTDGNQVSGIEVESRPAMLVVAAQEFVRTWKFEQHNRTSFDTTFRYTLSNVNCIDDKGTATLNLPAEMDLSAPA
jgi:hypothetical protein